MNFNWNPPQPEPREVIEEIPCSNPECEHGWDLEMNDECEECYGAGHYDNKCESCNGDGFHEEWGVDWNSFHGAYAWGFVHMLCLEYDGVGTKI